METKHTKGPWIYKKTGLSENDGEIVGDDNVVVGKIHLPVTDSSKPETTFYNAKLIAAAPELLEACQEVYNTKVKNSDCPELMGYVIELLENAIKKATE